MMTTHTVPAAEVHLGDRVLLTPKGPVRRVTMHRLQGTPPVVVLARPANPDTRPCPPINEHRCHQHAWRCGRDAVMSLHPPSPEFPSVGSTELD